MEETKDVFEEAARIVEAHAQGESNERVIELLAPVARDVRVQLLER